METLTLRDDAVSEITWPYKGGRNDEEIEREGERRREIEKEGEIIMGM